jgi:hypothetical protein
VADQIALSALGNAFPIWKATHAEVEKSLTSLSADRLRNALRVLV